VQESETRVDVATAARLLGISQDGVRKRIKRGLLGAYRADGRTYVVLDMSATRADSRQNGHDRADPTRHDTSATDQTACLIATLEGEVAHLRHELEVRNAELERKDTIIMQLARAAAQQVALPAPNTTSETASADRGIDNTSRPRPWWRRLLG
jgi:hypothetical protein